MELCHSVNNKRGYDSQLVSPQCRLPVYSTLSQLIEIIEKLKSAQNVAIISENTLQSWVDKMATSNSSNSGTVECLPTTTAINKLELEEQLKKLQQVYNDMTQDKDDCVSKLELKEPIRKLQLMYDSLNHEKTEQIQRIKEVEQKLKSSQENNRKFLDKNKSLTALNRKLQQETANVCKENKDQKEQLEQARRRIKELTQQLNQEKLEKGSLEIKLQELEALKQKLSKQSKTLSALQKSCEEKDRRLEVLRHRKTKNNHLIPGIKETYFGFDEDDSVHSSDTSFSSCGQGSSSEDEFPDQIVNNYQQLMNDFLELQRAHAMLQQKNGGHIDIQRDYMLRKQLDEEIESNGQLQSQIQELTKINQKLKDKLQKKQDQIDNLEFRLLEYEFQDVPHEFSTLETIEEDPLEMMMEEKEEEENLDHSKKHIMEQSLIELQSKISSLQQEKAVLEDKINLYERESQEDSEVIEVLEVKKTVDQDVHKNASTGCHGDTKKENKCDIDDEDDKSSSYVSMDTGSIGDSEIDNSKCDDGSLSIENKDSNKLDLSRSPSPAKTDRMHSMSPRGDRIHSPSPRPEGLRGDVFDLNSHMNTILLEMAKLHDENNSLKKHLHENNLFQEKCHSENNLVLETKIAEMNVICENLQEKIYCYEMTDKQLKDKLKLAEHTINDLESSEGMLRDKLEELQKSDTELKRSLSVAEQKIHELREISLDKDNVEQAIRDKVQALEKAESIACQKIAELEAHNQMLQQRLDLRDELEDESELVENLQERVIEVQTENLELQKKINELEENERTLTNNWLKVADADANRLECLEEKVKMLESANQDLKDKLREQQENVLSSPRGLSLAVELSESEKSQDSYSEQSNELLVQKLKQLENELHVKSEEKATALEKFQEKIEIYKENEIKLTETIAEMEHEEDKLKNRLRMYENMTSSDSMRSYEKKVRGLQSSQEDLLERLDCMEEHEENLKERLREVEKSYGKKVYLLEKEIAEFIIHEEEMSSEIEEHEKHESELMEKINNLEKEKLNLETENKFLKEQFENTDKELSHARDEIASLFRTNGQLQQELDQSQAENGDLNEKLMEIQDIEKNNAELKCEIENLKIEKNSINEKFVDLKKAFDNLKIENSNLQEKVGDNIDTEIVIAEQEKHMIELESEKAYLSENYDRIKTEMDRSHVEFTELKKKLNDLENNETRVAQLENDLKELSQQKVSLSENFDKLKNDFEQIQSENDDLNERVIELDKSEQECLEKVEILEEKASKCSELEKKCEILLEEETTLKARIQELEQVEQSFKEYMSTSGVDTSFSTDKDVSEQHDQSTDTEDLMELNKQVENLGERCSCDKSTDTSDLSEGQVRVTGLFERVQQLELENTQLSDKLSSMEFSENHVRDLSNKVKLLEESESSLMEQVVELEEKEDQLKRELAKARTSVNYVPELEDEIAELQESIKIVGDEKETLESEVREQLRKSQEFEVTVFDLQQQNEQVMKNLEKEKQKVESLLKGEERLLKSISSEKCKNEDLQTEMKSIQDELEELRKKCSEYEEKDSKLQQIDKLQCEKSVTNETKPESVHKNSVSPLPNNTEINEQVIQLEQVPTVSAEITEQSDQSKHQPLGSAETICAPDENSNLVSNSAELKALKLKCSELEEEFQSLSEREYKQNLLIDELENRCLEFEDNLKIKMSTEKYQKSKIQDLESLVQHLKKRLSKSKDTKLNQSDSFELNTLKPHLVSDDSIDQLFADNMKVLEKDSNHSGANLKELQDSFQSLQNVVQGLVKEFVITFGADSVALESNTFPWIKKLPACINDTFRQSLIELMCSKVSIEDKLMTLEEEKRQRLTDIRQKDDKIFELQNRVISLQSSESKLQENIRLLELSEKSLLKKVQNIETSNKENKASSSDKTDDDRLLKESIHDNPYRIDTVERALKVGKFSSDTMLDAPEDILRQRIGELDKVEKHLKQQLTDLEQDRQELHDIARKDKALIHDQNVKIRELQLSEKVLKEQIDKYEATEQDLYNKIRELEDQVEKMEDKIKELKILEMRLKELVHRYKLDEEVWLSKSESLVTSVTELSVSEANLKKTLEGIAKEKEGLSEKSQYLEMRLKELENAEANLVQRVKDQENKEMNLNAKIQELHVVSSNSELQLSELQNVNMDVSQRFNHAVQENAALSHHIVNLQNQLEMLNQQVVTLSDSELRLKKELESVKNNEKNLISQVNEHKVGNVDTTEKLRQLEEAEVLLKDKIHNLQRSENRLRYRVHELESSQKQMLVGSAEREEMGPVIYRDAKLNQKLVSQSMRETPGHIAETQMNGNKAQFSQPIHELADNLIGLDQEISYPISQSDASTVEEETLSKAVQRRNHMRPNGQTTTDDRRQLINDLVSHLDVASDVETANEEVHWKTVESLKKGPPTVTKSDNEWISVGKATSLHSSKNKMSRLNDEELVLGLTLPSETESQIYTQNDTDSLNSSPVIKRRKFRPSESTDSLGPPPPLPSSMQPSLQSRTMDSFETSYNALSSGPESGDEVQNGKDSSKLQRLSRSSGFGAVSMESGIDSGRGTASASSAPKRPSLHERIAQISHTLQNKPSSRSDLTDDEDSAFMWKTKASEVNRLLDVTDRENKSLKEEINRLEKDLEDKCRYILILEAFIEKLHQLLKEQDTKSDREVIQVLEAEMEKLKVEITESGNKKLDISQDPVALTTQLNKKERELNARVNEVTSLMKELKQWQDECRIIEDMRTNALDSMKCLEMEVTELQDAEKLLKNSKDAYNNLKAKYEEVEQAKNNALVTIAPLKAKIKRLCLKCRDKDDLLRRLGVELRKLKGPGKPVRLLEELNGLEALMANEEYNGHDSDMGSPHNISPRFHPAGGESIRSPSASSLSDSDSEIKRQRLPDQYDRHQRPLQPNNSERQHLPRITRSAHSPNSRGDNLIEKDHSPLKQAWQSPQNQSPNSSQKNSPHSFIISPNTDCIVVSDYNPEEFSTSGGRQHLELPLKEDDKVRVTGPVDQHGYCQAQVNGRVGLVPARYLLPLSQLANENGRQKLLERRRKQLTQCPSHLSNVPEKIIQMNLDI
ncbi:hypothetical protein KUTeg_021127 [Tegillarca granosa]|uniref:SH3 domain-containing protein n=1 Tax=Tegillarca granosa TaxID=220873 RepID=A0ABQ9EF52_TEGGR|nr:hypothetical protein KUTeg_021127 [Tegillarca granosa]